MMFINFEVTSLILIASCFIALCGSVIIWKDSVNITHSASHASSLAIAISSIFQIPYFIISAIIGIIFGGIKSTINRQNIKITTNDAIYIMGNVSMAIGILLEISFNHLKNIHQYLTGDIFLFTIQDMLALGCISVFLGCIYLKNINNIIINITYNRKFWILESFFINALEVSGIIIFTKIFGIITSSFVLGVLPIIAKKISKNPIQMIINIFVISLFILLLSYFLAIYFDFYFSFISSGIVLWILVLFIVFRK